MSYWSELYPCKLTRDHLELMDNILVENYIYINAVLSCIHYAYSVVYIWMYRQCMDGGNAFILFGQYVFGQIQAQIQQTWPQASPAEPMSLETFINTDNGTEVAVREDRRHKAKGTTCILGILHYISIGCLLFNTLQNTFNTAVLHTVHFFIRLREISHIGMFIFGYICT